MAKSVAYSTVAEAPMRRAKRSVAIEHSAGGSSPGGMDVYYLQVLCNQYGISVNTDGIWGANTEKAVRQLPQLSYGSNEGAVYHVQNVLKIPVDGYYGSNTESAVRIWQSAHGISADGIVGRHTWETFAGQKLVAKNGGSATSVTPPVIKPDIQEEKPNSLMDKIKSIPEYIDIISEEVQDNPRDFAIGILKSLDENGYGGTASWIVSKFNLGSLEGDSVAYMTGKVIGDAASTATGIATILGGIAQEALGISADGTVVLAPVGVSLNAAGALTISYGATVATVSSKKGMEDAGKLFEKCDSITRDRYIGPCQISEGAIKDVKKRWGQKGVDAFEKAMNKGMARESGPNGIKRLKGNPYKGKYTHEIKVKNKEYGDYRIYGYKDSDGNMIFDYFDKGLH